MPVIIRYTWPSVGDSFLCPSFSGPAKPVWRNGQINKALAYEFPDEATAKTFLAEHGYELDPLKVTFEPVADVDTSDIPEAGEEWFKKATLHTPPRKGPTKIKFDRPTRFDARGRNGYLPCYGVELSDMGDGDFAEIHLHPIGARGNASEACRIPIRKNAIPALLAELLHLLPRIEQLQFAGAVLEAESAKPIDVSRVGEE